VARRPVEVARARDEYSLTPLGWSITSVLMSLCVRAEQHLDEPLPMRPALAA
jgi:DNA-binding HxlR family transcriptional regulator